MHWIKTTIVVLTCAATLAAEAQTISGSGARQCGDFMQAVKLNSDVAINGFVSWAQGYLSGFNATNPNGRDAAIDPNGLRFWLSSHCSTHPTDSYYAAVQKLVDELTR